MPVAYGGGVNSVEHIRKILSCGVEKVVLNSVALRRPELVREAACEFGSQAITVSIDVKRKLFGGYQIYGEGGSRATGYDPVVYAKRMQELGAGELLVTSIDRDGTMKGYDADLISRVASGVSIPVIAAGGAGKVSDFTAAKQAGAAAVAAGAMFVFHGPYRAVLITYPSQAELSAALN